MGGLITVNEALKRVLGSIPAPRTEAVPFRSAPWRLLAEDISAPEDIPSFNRSAMDGYAFLAADVAETPAQLEIAGEIRAGEGNPGAILRGQAMAIMTGAPVPAGADTVQKIEETSLSEGRRTVSILKSVKKGANIRHAGSESRAGDRVLEAGRFLGPSEMAVLAMCGIQTVKVQKMPSIAIVSTGDELVGVEEIPGPGQIRNSNAWSLLGQVQTMGLEAEYLGIARDNREDLERFLLEGLKRDVLIMTGGVSVGEYDFVKDVFLDAGLEILFDKVAMKPGKPTVFARKGDCLVFGLPGNPVSTFVAFENFVRPALARLYGMKGPGLLKVRGVLTEEVRQSAGRTSYLPARVTLVGERCEIEPLAWKGSGDVVGFARADAMLVVPPDQAQIGCGETAEAILMADYHLRLTHRS